MMWLLTQRICLCFLTFLYLTHHTKKSNSCPESLYCFSPSLDVIVIHFWTFMAQFFYTEAFPNSCGLCGALAPSYCLGKVYSRDLGIQSVNSLIFPHPKLQPQHSSCTINYNLERSMTKECQRENPYYMEYWRTLQITTQYKADCFKHFKSLPSRVEGNM